MRYVSIKKEIKKDDGSEVFLVPALTLKNSQGATKQRIPHPLGDGYLEFSTEQEAVKAIVLSGFKPILSDGSKPIERDEKPSNKVVASYDELVFDALIRQTKDINSTVVAAAITALGELGEFKLLDLFIEKLGEENELIRVSAINAILNFGGIALKSLIPALKDENWVRRNSVLVVIQRLLDSESVKPEKLFSVLVEMTEDKNTIVKTSAITALGKAYKLYKKE